MSTVPPEPYQWTPEALTYVRTTTYHWPNFNDNATDIEGEWTNSEGIGTGPFGFGSDVKLTDTSVSGKILDRDDALAASIFYKLQCATCNRLRYGRAEVRKERATATHRIRI